MGMTTKEILQGVHDWTLQKVVYDISAAHPDGQGNPRPYADLTAALDSNNGGGVPQSLQKGGMRVQFIQGTVQSSDNKYIQARYMSSSTAVADFTNVSNWQGVDNTIAFGSKNLVESGTIFEQENIYDDITSAFTIQEDKCVIGHIGQAYISVYFEGGNVTYVEKSNSAIEENLIIQGTFPKLSRHLTFINSNGTITRTIKFNVGVELKSEIIFNENEKGVYINAEDGLKIYTTKNIKDVVNEHTESLLAVNNELANVKREIIDEIPYFFAENIDYSTLNYRSGYINSDGQFVSLGETSTFKVLELNVETGNYIMVRSIRGSVISALIWKSDGEDGYIKVVDDAIVGETISTLGKMCISLAKAELNTTYYISANIGNPLEILKYSQTSLEDKSIYKKVDNIENSIDTIKDVIVVGASDISYVAFGDSITYGVGATNFFGYPNKLNQYFAFDTFENKGISASSFCKQDNENGIIYSQTHSLSNFEGLITVAGGTNDFGNLHSPLGSFDSIKNVSFANLTPPSTTYSENYTFAEAFRYTIEDLQRNNPNAKIVVLIPINRYNATTDYGYGDLDAYREMEIKICKLLGIEYVDMSQCGIPSFNSSVYFRLNGGSPDGLHPNDFGYELMTSFLIPRFNNYIIEVRYRNT